MAAVQGRNRQNVHESQNDGEEGRHVPELMPVPRGGEDAADGAEAAQLLGAFLGEEVLHLSHVALQCVHTQHDAGGEGGEEGVFLLHDGQQAGGAHVGRDAYLVDRVGGQRQGVSYATSYIGQADIVRRLSVSLAPEHLFLEVEVGDVVSVQLCDAIARLQSGQCGGASGNDAVDYKWVAEIGKASTVCQQAVH